MFPTLLGRSRPGRLVGAVFTAAAMAGGLIAGCGGGQSPTAATSSASVPVGSTLGAGNGTTGATQLHYSIVVLDTVSPAPGEPTIVGPLFAASISDAAINNVGQATTSASSVWQSGHQSLLGTLGGLHTQAHMLNDQGQVVGASEISTHDLKGGVINHAFLYQNGHTDDLGTLGGDNSYAFGVNNGGQVVGAAETGGTSGVHPFLWQNGRMTDLSPNTAAGDYSYAVAINSTGQVIGYAGNLGSAARHAVLWQSGGTTDLGTLPSDALSWASAISDDGLIVGVSSKAGGAFEGGHAVLWQNGTVHDLGTLSGPHSAALGVNRAAQIVGWSDTSTLVSTGSSQGMLRGAHDTPGGPVGSYYERHAFLYADGKMVDLNTQIALDAGWILTGASAINTQGQIVGDGIYNGHPHFYFLTPVKS